MKVGIAQINAVIGDFPGNAKRLLQAYRECLENGADLVVTPELSLPGYPPRDLMLRSGFVEKGLQALDYLAGEVKEVPLLVGYIDRTDHGKPGKPFRNAAAFLHRGEIPAKRWKTLLPTYDVFDERRYFEPGENCEPILWNGLRLGITICEDIWIEGYQERPLYDRDPVKELCDRGIDVLLNLSASPFHLGKPEIRRELAGELARETGLPVVFANAAGAQDELIFDGHSLVASPDGRIAVQMRGFEPACATVDLEDLPAGEAPLEVAGAEEQIFRALVSGLREYAWKCGFRSACLGLSGGIDSALVAVIAAEALGPENVRGLTLPGAYSSAGSVTDSMALAANLGIRCDSVPIEETFGSVKSAMAPLFPGLPPDVTEENMQARIRGLLLMALSNKEGHLLLSTGNKSELAVGYCTKYGDMCGGLAVISDIPKTRVFELCRWINREHEIIPWSILEKPPSAELRPNQKDQDTLPPYPVLDAILELYVERQMAAEEIIAAGHDEGTVRWVQRRVDRNEWKRRQAAPGLRMTTKAFGSGRQMPLAQGYGG
jgi:NAD+ synthetase